MGFVELRKISDSYTRMLFSLYSHNFASTNIFYDVFNEIFSQRIEVLPKKIVFDKDLISKDEFSLLAEWLLVAIAKYIAGIDKVLLARLRRNIQSIAPLEVELLDDPRVDMLVVIAFLELIYLIKYAIFSINEGL